MLGKGQPRGVPLVDCRSCAAGRPVAAQASRQGLGVLVPAAVRYHSLCLGPRLGAAQADSLGRRG